MSPPNDCHTWSLTVLTLLAISVVSGQGYGMQLNSFVLLRVTRWLRYNFCREDLGYRFHKLVTIKHVEFQMLFREYYWIPLRYSPTKNCFNMNAWFSKEYLEILRFERWKSSIISGSLTETGFGQWLHLIVALKQRLWSLCLSISHFLRNFVKHSWQNWKHWRVWEYINW